MSYALSFKPDAAVEVGLDEAGRGSLFGRLYVGAVVFAKEEEDFFDHGATLKTIRDSKTLTPRNRAILYDYIQEAALDKAVAFAEAAEVDEFNVLQADLRCMHRALDSLTIPVDRILVDGDHWKPWRNKDNDGRDQTCELRHTSEHPVRLGERDTVNIKQSQGWQNGQTSDRDVEAHTIVDGDASYLSIAAAGILAKVAHDEWITEVCATHPEWVEHYGLLGNKGYGTAAHMRGLQLHGATEEHRRSFAPVARALGLTVKEKSKAPKKGRWAGED
jgi:ribonuclease HII